MDHLVEQLVAMPRFWSKVDQTASCWVWRASVTRNGYGKFKLNGRTVSAHRMAYELLAGAIPEGLTIDHLCRNRACVNPAHLEPVTMQENILRGDSPAAHDAKKTNCVNGHPFSRENTRVHDGKRRCRMCLRARTRRWQLANTEHVAAYAHDYYQRRKAVIT